MQPLVWTRVRCTFLRAAASLWAAGTADVTTTAMRTTLTTAEAKEHDEETGSNDYEEHRQPV